MWWRGSGVGVAGRVGVGVGVGVVPEVVAGAGPAHCWACGRLWRWSRVEIVVDYTLTYSKGHIVRAT